MSHIQFCGEVVQPFVEATTFRPDLPTIQIIGGNGSAALKDPGTEIDLDADVIYAKNVCDLPRLREDGTLRDMDVLVLSTDSEEIAAIEELAHDVVGDELEVSIFGLKRATHLADQMNHPLKSTAIRFLSDRYMNERPDDLVHGNKAIYPFRGKMSEEFMGTSMLVTEGVGIPTPTSHPGATMLNYMTRSISGLRPKDEEKVGEIADNLLGKYPELKDWIIDGPGKETFEFARVLHTLRESKRNPKVLHLGKYFEVEPYDYEDLIKQEAFIAQSLSPRGQRTVVAAAHTKARVLHFAESQQRIVTWFQMNVEQRISNIVHNK